MKNSLFFLESSKLSEVEYFDITIVFSIGQLIFRKLISVNLIR